VGAFQRLHPSASQDSRVRIVTWKLETKDGKIIHEGNDRHNFDDLDLRGAVLEGLVRSPMKTFRGRLLADCAKRMASRVDDLSERSAITCIF
jgi:hypothetical protein